MFEHFLKICDMNGYGIYIWPSYALLLIVIAWQIFAAIKRNAAVHSKLKQDLWSGSNSDQQT